MRFFYLLTPSSELPKLPPAVPSYVGVHAYTILQIVTTIVIFIVTLTKAAPVFPVIIIALVPIRLVVMKKFWSRETLRFVDAWACREGTVEDDEDRRMAERLAEEGNGLGHEEGTVGMGSEDVELREIEAGRV
jgi:hypothetical protein